MKYFALFSQIIVFCVSVSAISPPKPSAVGSTSHAVANVIEGTVYDPNHRPVPDLWVELQNEFNMTYGRIRTGPSGRFTFGGVKSGRYDIKVYTSGTDFEEQTASVELVNV